MTAIRKTRPVKNRSRTSYPSGTIVYCWKFNHPQFGWIGCSDDDDWDARKSVITDRMALCEWPSELIKGVA